MKTLYDHQKRFLEKNPDRALLLWEGGLGKTIAAIEWRKKRPGAALVVCPKSIVGKWRRELLLWGASATVLSRDEVKKADLKPYKMLILDEAQDFAAPLFDRGRSARATVIYNMIKDRPGMPVLLLSATPVRSTPWNIHTLACYLGILWPLKIFRNQFFYMTDMFGSWHWEKKKNWRTMIRPYIEEVSDIVLMSDVVDVPIQHHQEVTVPWTKSQEDSLKDRGYLEPMAEWTLRHRAENGKEKFSALDKILDQYRKIIVVCHYREQIDAYAAAIKDREVFVLHGGTPDQDAVIEAAKSADDCVFIIQASMGAGFDADEFSVIVFASMSFKYIDYQQMKFRVKRIHNLHENTFIHLLGGKNDRAVYTTILAGQDFDPLVYMQKNAAT